MRWRKTVLTGMQLNRKIAGTNYNGYPRASALGPPLFLILAGLILSAGASCHDKASIEPARPPSYERKTMETMLLQIRHRGSAPSVDDVRRLFNLKTNEIDTSFGVVATDPSEELYTVLIDANAAN